MAKISKSDFIFKKHMSVGEVDAECDSAFLEECFIDTGDYEVLESTDSPQCIVLGRTGAGKSALLEQLEKNVDRAIRINPDELALRHISNSTILNFFEDAGVDLDIFYTLLWQHTFAVELIKNRYSIDTPAAKKTMFESLAELISGDPKKQQALKYIEQWGDKFWVDTESRIKEFTSKLEENLKGSIGASIPGFNFSAEGAQTLTDEQRSEVVYYGKQVVNSVQIATLAKVISLLAEDIFCDPQKKTYILIDRLDENWVEDKLRYKLIRALIETIRKFKAIRPVKIIITLRIDLLERVLEHTRDSGFQREKYKNLFLKLSWSKDQLKDLLDRRINLLLKHRYTNSEVSFEDIFPQKIDKVSSLEYILDRTLLRPRDAIMFVNECIAEAQGKSEIANNTVVLAEKTYSLERLESLSHEWFVEHPSLRTCIEFLSNKKPSFKVNALPGEEYDALALELASNNSSGTDIMPRLAADYINSNYPESNSFILLFKQNLFYVLYKTGVVGIKVDGPSSVKWVQDRTQDMATKKIEGASIIYVHRMLWRALGIDRSSQ